MAEGGPVIGITIGDPAGIGPEIALSAAKDEEVRRTCRPVVIGHQGLLRRCADAVNATLDGIEIVSIDSPRIEAVAPGVVSAEAGLAADAFIRRACELALAGEIDAICTAPINKESLRAAGVAHIGHTEMLAAYLGSPDPLTMFLTENLRIFFLSRHLSLRQAIDYVSLPNVAAFIGRVNTAMKQLGFANPRIGLAALNPHASDGGQFGNEEALHLVPAARQARQEGINVSDPIGADSVFAMALEGRFDCVISLYHDQGHIAAKTRDFHGTVTATLGLKILRTSVDHGTAFDIAWQGRASSVSIRAAILAAAQLLAAETRKGESARGESANRNAAPCQ